ncbi:MAG: preprotein translocase subunit SecE [Burkholderiales bacterium]
MNAPVKTTGTKTASHLFNYLAIVIVLLGLGLFYALKINIWLKWGIVLLSLAAALAIFFLISPTGLHLHSYVKDSWRELGKVVWPSRKEAMQFTWIVFLFVLILGLLLWLIDSSLSWLFYGVILGRGN